MEEESMPQKSSVEEAPSFGRSFRGTAELSMATAAQFSDRDDFPPEDDFEFAFAASIRSDSASADKIFRNGRILPSDGSIPSSSSEEKSSEDRRSSFSALESRRLRLRDVVVVGRSRSEGDKVRVTPKRVEKSCFFLFSGGHRSAGKDAEKKRGKGKERGLDVVSAQPMCDGRGIVGGGRGAIGGSRRSFLPYRQELVVGCFFCRAGATASRMAVTMSSPEKLCGCGDGRLNSQGMLLGPADADASEIYTAPR